ncbi:MAG TPA: glycoside hydrolase family 75 protein, partial [Polyangia bacterium]|nr:glycoside hydrolase family 75 protein [Polyangia bacterium]
SICSLKGGAGNIGGAIYFTADMDIDCDGLMTTHCPGTGADMDCCYQNQTSFSGPNSASNVNGKELASENTPYVVIPQDVVFPGLDQTNGGNIIAVIYNNQLEFGVFGDQGPTNIIGEASVRTANGLGIPPSPATGGVGGGVTYIVFVGTGSQPADMENIPQIQSLGAHLTESLLQNNP